MKEGEEKSDHPGGAGVLSAFLTTHYNQVTTRSHLPTVGCSSLCVPSSETQQLLEEIKKTPGRGSSEQFITANRLPSGQQRQYNQASVSTSPHTWLHPPQTESEWEKRLHGGFSELLE